MNDSQQLLTEYTRSGSEAAFGEMVNRYLPLVYSTAVRLLDGNTDLAKDAAQVVFVDLARKAASLSSGVLLGGWLHRHTCFVVANMTRSERRRQSREREAVEMNTLEDHSEANLAHVRPFLDEAINELGAGDRTAILLRYFEQLDFCSVGAALGSSENAAQKRVARALEELRSLLTRRGVTLSLAVLGTMLASGLVTAAPAGLAAAISQAAMAGAASGASLTFTLWRAIAMNKFKFGILTGAAIGCAVTLAAGHFFNSYQIEIKPRAASARKATAISFDGRKWMPWRTEFAVQGDKLVSLPQARAGYDYGHLAGGRGPVLMTGIGDSHLKNYRAEFEYCVTGPDPTFNPYNLPEDYHDGCIFFHVADARENWNERGNSYYLLGVRGDGTWALLCTYNNYCAVPVGYGNVHRDAERELAEGEGLRIDRVNGNKYAIELSGKRIRIWVDGDKIVDMIDNKMDETIGGQTLDHGGVGFHWGLDAMGWMRNFSLKAL